MPNLEEFLAAARCEFHYLITEFLFTEEPIDKVEYHNPFSVRFEGQGLMVIPEGIGWGSSVTVTIGELAQQNTSVVRGIPLCAILEARGYTPNLLKGDQIVQLGIQARELREHARDVLEGDCTVFAEARRIVDLRIAKSRAQEETERFEAASIQAAGAFHRKEYGAVRRLLEPFSDRLSDHQRKLLSYCEKKLG